MKRTLIMLGLVLYLLNAADLATTQIVLDNGGYEANPFMVQIVGTWAGFILKLVVVPTLIGGMVWAGSKYAAKTCAAVLTVGVAVYVTVVASNLNVISTLL